MAQPFSLTDEQMLTALDLIERQRWTASAVGAQFGVSRSVILGLTKRVRDDLAASEAAPFARGTGPAVRPGNRDGDLGPLWWKDARANARRDVEGAA